MGLEHDIDGQALDGMAFAYEQALWAWPLLPNRSPSRRLRSITLVFHDLPCLIVALCLHVQP